MKAFQIFLLTLLMVSCQPSYAEDSTAILYIGAWSNHWGFNTDSDINETHNLLGGEWQGVSAGYFVNSYDDDTVFIAKAWRYRLAENWQGSLSLGINYGYKECYGKGDSTKNICPHGWVGIGYTKYFVVPVLRLQPGVVIFSPEIHF